MQLWQPSRLVPYHLSGEDPSYYIIGGVPPQLLHMPLLQLLHILSWFALYPTSHARLHHML